MGQGGARADRPPGRDQPRAEVHLRARRAPAHGARSLLTAEDGQAMGERLFQPRLQAADIHRRLRRVPLRGAALVEGDGGDLRTPAGDDGAADAPPGQRSEEPTSELPYLM